MYQIVWKRTVIGGDELHHDFCAYVENINIARIYRTKDSDGRFVWSVNMQIGDALSESCLTRQDAIEWVEHRFAAFLLTELGNSDPQEWPHDQLSAQLRYLKATDPSAYRAMLEALRSGHLQRIDTKR